MSAENITVKKEPDEESSLSIEVDNGGAGVAPSVILPEFICIKEEVHSDEPYVSVKLEPINNDYGENWLNTDTSNGSEFEHKLEIEIEPIGSENDGTNNELQRDNKNTHETTFESGGVTTNSKTSLVCHICHKSFASKHSVQRHILTHNRKKHKCELCPKEYLTERQYNIHVAKHNIHEDYKCSKCDNIIPYNSQNNVVKRSCDDCKEANRGRFAKKHLICPMCGKLFLREYLLKSHLLKHTTERPFTCDMCKMSFKHKSAMIRHIQLHKGLKPYSCKFCAKTFTHPGLMKPHMRRHTGEKPYTCPICKKSFAHKHNMQRHCTRHEKEKNLVCEICNRKFPKESRLKYHMRIHTSEKCFPCRLCPKKFSYRQNILRHYNKKHPNIPYDCKDTDASVALKIWDEIVNKKIRKVDRVQEKETFIPPKTITIKIEREDNEEYIIPDRSDTIIDNPISIKKETDNNIVIEKDSSQK